MKAEVPKLTGVLVCTARDYLVFSLSFGPFASNEWPMI
jgi:hypothetical protein